MAFNLELLHFQVFTVKPRLVGVLTFKESICKVQILTFPESLALYVKLTAYYFF
ncbi:hypothetical protein LEP1GSC088_1830 [Leptospira interrogans str. L1207]|nr:hypothetical protein LEP1GSC088_1830 [Leptospira interrogans str. L1207]